MRDSTRFGVDIYIEASEVANRIGSEKRKLVMHSISETDPRLESSRFV